MAAHVKAVRFTVIEDVIYRFSIICCEKFIKVLELFFPHNLPHVATHVFKHEKILVGLLDLVEHDLQVLL
jgi:hypothetical protein